MTFGESPTVCRHALRAGWSASTSEDSCQDNLVKPEGHEIWLTMSVRRLYGVFA